jgi:hypothetical protein
LYFDSGGGTRLKKLRENYTTQSLGDPFLKMGANLGYKKNCSRGLLDSKEYFLPCIVALGSGSSEKAKDISRNYPIMIFSFGEFMPGTEIN